MLQCFFVPFFFVQLVSVGRRGPGGTVAGETGDGGIQPGLARGWGRGCADRHMDVRQIQSGERHWQLTAEQFISLQVIFNKLY